MATVKTVKPAPRKVREQFEILLVEDNPDHAELIRRGFEGHPDARIVHLEDGEAALDYLFRRGPFTDEDKWPMPRVILLDLRLPRIDGLEVLSRIRATGRFDRIPVIVLSTSYADNDVGNAYERHANSYLVKPLEYTEFVDMMDDLGTYWLNRNQYVRAQQRA